MPQKYFLVTLINVNSLGALNFYNTDFKRDLKDIRQQNFNKQQYL